MTGARYVPPTQEILGRRMAAADRPGEHLWIMTAAWRVRDPESVRDGELSLLDTENIVAFAGTGCFKCERPYSRQMAKRPCPGSVAEAQP